MQRSKLTIIDAPSEATDPSVVEGELCRTRKRSTPAPPELPPPVDAAGETTKSRRPARVAHLLAFAHAIQEALEKKQITTRAEVARRLGYTRARVTQILDLTLLAPDIQEAILFLEAVDGIEPLSEHTLRSVVRIASWEEQRKEWKRIVDLSPHKLENGL